MVTDGWRLFADGASALLTLGAMVAAATVLAIAGSVLAKRSIQRTRTASFSSGYRQRQRDLAHLAATAVSPSNAIDGDVVRIRGTISGASEGVGVAGRRCVWCNREDEPPASAWAVQTIFVRDAYGVVAIDDFARARVHPQLSAKARVRTRTGMLHEGEQVDCLGTFVALARDDHEGAVLGCLREPVVIAASVLVEGHDVENTSPTSAQGG